MKIRLLSVFLGIFALAPSAILASGPADIIRGQAEKRGIEVRSLFEGRMVSGEMVAPSQSIADEFLNATGKYHRIKSIRMVNQRKTSDGYQFDIIALTRPGKKTGSNDPKPEVDERDLSTEAYLALQDILKRRMDDPYSAKFEPKRRAIIKQFPGQEYVIRGHFRAKNRFGAYVRKDYVSKIQLSDETWRLTKLRFAD